MVLNKSFSLSVGPFVAIAAQSSLIDDKVSNSLCMLNWFLVVVNFVMSIVSGTVEAELNLVDTVAESEDGVIFTFDHADVLFLAWNGGHVVWIPSGDWDKWSHSFV